MNNGAKVGIFSEKRGLVLRVFAVLKIEKNPFYNSMLFN